ncbi:MAG: DUF916 and DUF3324 domain-containing protein [Vagococcus sp.]|uniref:DUF916 and DUF3324 domain-containing protein n=1 Tax=Vagococcus TaxID=2737 RepID=UPI002FC9D7FD
MKKKNNIIKKVCLVIILLFSFVTSVDAADDKKHGIGFEIRPILPQTQIDNSLGYYYFETKPGVKQEIELSVLNVQDKDITVEIFVENAISTKTGSIDYTTNLEKVHDSLKNPMSEILAPTEKVVTVKPEEEKIVFLEINPPAETYEGAKMGRVIVKEKTEESSVGVSQEYQYGIGVITSESGDLFNDGDILKLEDAKAFVSNGSKVIQGELVNPLPKTIEDLEVRAFVTKKGDSKKLKEKNIDNFSFAPNSKVLYEIPWGLTNFETGEYTFNFKASNDFESFDLTKDFKIRGEDAKKLNNQAAFSVQTPNFMKMLIIIMNVILILLCIILYMRNKKWITEIKARKRSNRGKSKKGRKKK